MPTPVETPPSSTEDRTVAIVSYLTIIGFIVAIVLHRGKKTALGTFHLRQCLGLLVAALAYWFAAMVLALVPVIGALIGLLAFPVGGLIFFALWILGLIAAVNGQCKPLPVIGEKFQQWFGNAFD